jgi:hypothetical protein
LITIECPIRYYTFFTKSHNKNCILLSTIEQKCTTLCKTNINILQNSTTWCKAKSTTNNTLQNMHKTLHNFTSAYNKNAQRFTNFTNTNAHTIQNSTKITPLCTNILNYTQSGTLLNTYSGFNKPFGLTCDIYGNIIENSNVFILSGLRKH